MLKYLVILLADDAVSYCHYTVPGNSSRLIGSDDLKKGILFAMKENLNIQFVYPRRPLPDAYRGAVESIDHTKIMPAASEDFARADIVVSDRMEEVAAVPWLRGQLCVLRLDRSRLTGLVPFVERIVGKISRLNVVVTDPDRFTDADFESYASVLAGLSDLLRREYAAGNAPQINLLTDRMMLTAMNNCNAGVETLTLAPNGRFYVCPAFYYEDPTRSCGDPETGFELKNDRLYRLSHAPICRRCDAWQCRRCVWLNRKTTLEVNTPSHEQCVAAHLERNESRRLLGKIRENGAFMPKIDIPELDYLDPFEKYNEW